MFRRLKNLWYLSGINLTLSDNKEELLLDNKPIKVKKKYYQAHIVELENPLDTIEL
jgi:hypothetical protein